MTDDTFDLDAMLAAVTDRTRLIFVCNPNNPTSTVVDPDALTRFVEAVPSHIVIALDEAYVEYIRDGMLPDSLELVRAHSNVVVLRTFSKAYGLAGLRVGYAVGHPELIIALDKVYVPFTVYQHLAGRGDRLAGRRRRAVGPHRRRGRRTHPGQRRAARRRVPLPPSQANFVWLPLGPRTTDFVEQAADARIVVRPYGADGVRVSIGAPEENDALLRFARDWINVGIMRRTAMSQTRKIVHRVQGMRRADLRCRTR